MLEHTFSDFNLDAKSLVASVARMHSSSVTIGNSAKETGCVGLIIVPAGEFVLANGRLVILSKTGFS